MDRELVALSEQFFADMAETLDEVERLVLRLEGEPDDDDSLDALFRAFHTLKGNAGVVGESEIQAACHAVESDLAQARGYGVDGDRIQRTFEALDLLRRCASEGGLSGLEAELTALASRSGTSADASASGAAVGDGAATAGTPAAGSTVASEGSGAAPLPLDELTRLLAAFAPLRNLALRLMDKDAATDASTRNALVQDVGLATIDFQDAVPAGRERIRTTSSYLEELLNLLMMGGIDYDPDRFSILHHLVDDLEQMLKAELIIAPYVVRLLVDDPGAMNQLLPTIDAIEQASLIAVSIELSFDELARTGMSLEYMQRAAAHPRHTVFFVVDDETRAAQATRFLAHALGDYPLVGTTIWDGLLKAVAPEE